MTAEDEQRRGMKQEVGVGWIPLMTEMLATATSVLSPGSGGDKGFRGIAV